jgi:DNA-binding PadR family transcriptional regulator
MRESTTGYVILGVLDQTGAASGYEIRRYVTQSVGHFWHESFGQIYPELRRLAGQRLIAPEGRRAAGERGRRRYRIRAEGRRALEAWLARPAAPERLRSEFLIKLFFGRAVGPAACRAQIEAAVRRHAERHAQLRGLLPLILEDDAESPDLVYGLATLRHGLLASAARKRAAEDARTLLDAHARGGNRAVLAAWRALEPKGEVKA